LFGGEKGSSKILEFWSSKVEGRETLNAERSTLNAQVVGGDWEVLTAGRREDVSRGGAENAEEIGRWTNAQR